MESDLGASIVTESDDAPALFGEGDFPDTLLRFSWGAYFFPWLWALRRGLWWVLWLWAFQFVSGPVLRRFLPGGLRSPMWQAYAILVNIAVTCFVLWLSVNGNRLAWDKASSSKPPERKLHVHAFVRGESTWILFGVFVEVLWFASAGWALFEGTATVSTTVGLAIEACALLIAIYLSRNVDSVLWQRLTSGN